MLLGLLSVAVWIFEAGLSVLVGMVTFRLTESPLLAALSWVAFWLGVFHRRRIQRRIH